VCSTMTHDQIELPNMPEHQEFDGKWFSISEASQATRRARITIRRYLDAGKFPQAKRDDSHIGPPDSAPWLIPLPDLLSAGLTPNAAADIITLNGNGASEDEPLSQDRELDLLQAELDRAKAAEAEWRERAKIAEALAGERSGRIDDLRLALRAIGPAPTPEPDAVGPTAQEPSHGQGPGHSRRKWWSK